MLSRDSWAWSEHRCLNDLIASMASSARFCCFITIAMSLSALSTLSPALIALQNNAIALSGSLSTNYMAVQIEININPEKKKPKIRANTDQSEQLTEDESLPELFWPWHMGCHRRGLCGWHGTIPSMTTGTLSSAWSESKGPIWMAWLQEGRWCSRHLDYWPSCSLLHERSNQDIYRDRDKERRRYWFGDGGGEVNTSFSVDFVVLECSRPLE